MPPATRKRIAVTPELVTALGIPQAPEPSLATRLLAHFKQPNVYKRSFMRFRTELVYTQDEATGRVMQFPDWPFQREVDDALIEERLLFIEKARRVMASWHLCAFDIWVVAGGQDTRWEASMLGNRNRQVILGCLKQEGLQGAEWFLRERVKFILDQFEERGFREQWPGFPHWRYTATEIQFSNGSRITAVPSGPDKCRGPGATLIHLEEVSFWQNAAASINAAIPVIRGGGKLICCSTPQVGSYASRIVKGELGQQVWR